MRDDEIVSAFHEAYDSGLTNGHPMSGGRADYNDELEEVMAYIRKLRACVHTADEVLGTASEAYDEARFALDPWTCDETCRDHFEFYEQKRAPSAPFAWVLQAIRGERPCDLCKTSVRQGFSFRKAVSA
jgi:hypothetical protein